jgi:NADH:ubiquinone oxidoreductase subunit 5 (subunit L)/multisubunit Na+/H+ antiporter MnhA subunit
VIFSVDYMHGEAQLGRYYALVLLFVGAMVGLALSGNSVRRQRDEAFCGSPGQCQ